MTRTEFNLPIEIFSDSTTNNLPIQLLSLEDINTVDFERFLNKLLRDNRNIRVYIDEVYVLIT